MVRIVPPDIERHVLPTLGKCQNPLWGFPGAFDFYYCLDSSSPEATVLKNPGGRQLLEMRYNANYLLFGI